MYEVNWQRHYSEIDLKLQEDRAHGNHLDNRRLDILTIMEKPSLHPRQLTMTQNPKPKTLIRKN